MKYPTKWDKAHKMFNIKLKACDNDAMKAIEKLSLEALKQTKLAKQHPESVAYLRAKWNRNAATYGINLAFGKDLRKEDA